MHPKQFTLAILLCTVTVASKAQQTYNWNDSPQNWQNSQQNWNNSSNNWNNSPSNWNNSPNNYNSTNGVFDNQGNRIGYETKSPEGVTNIFDNNGNRLGYLPPRKNE
jgi:predicted PurR-regulated permease PerM